MGDYIPKQQLIDTINALTVDGEFSEKDASYLINYLLEAGQLSPNTRDLIQIRRGLSNELPNLAQGELGFTFDTGDLYVGGLNGNVKVAGNLAEDFASVTSLLNIKNDGSEDVSEKIVEYANDKDEIYLFFPQGRYRWENNIKLTNKKIKFVGANAVIEHYNNGPTLEIGDVLTNNTDEFYIQGLDFVNKRPKPATNGSGVVSLLVGDCRLSTIKDVNIYDAEQYGIFLRRETGNLESVVVDNVNVFNCAGTLATTTPIALETRASSNGRIKRIKISNSYFEVSDTYINSDGGITNVTLSNACKLQACDEVEIVNTTFVGGKENGTLTYSYDTRNVKMTNVTCRSNSPISKGLTITLSPLIQLYAVNCDLGVENFTQSIGVAENVKELKFENCRLQRITVVSGTPSNFKFDNCTFFLTTPLQIGVHNSFFNNCNIDVSSTSKSIVVVGSDNTINNFNTNGLIEIRGSNNKIIGGQYESIRYGVGATNIHVKGVVAISDDRPLRQLDSTASNITIEDSTFIKKIGGTFGIAYIQGSSIIIRRCSFIQQDKSQSIPYAIVVANDTDCQVYEKENNFDVNASSGLYSIPVGSTSFKRYKSGDTFINGGVAQIWNGTEFVNLVG